MHKELETLLKNLIQKIEAVLFYVAEPVQMKYLAEMLEVTEDEINEAVREMSRSDLDSGVSGLSVLEHDGTLALVTQPEMSEIIEKIVKEENDKSVSNFDLQVKIEDTNSNGATVR